MLKSQTVGNWHFIPEPSVGRERSPGDGGGGVVEEEGTEHAHLGAGRRPLGNGKGERMGVGSLQATVTVSEALPGLALLGVKHLTLMMSALTQQMHGGRHTHFWWRLEPCRTTPMTGDLHAFPSYVRWII